MALRTSAAAVVGLLETDDDETDIYPFIETANFVVTDRLTSSGYSAAKLELIERWLGAHFYSIKEPQRRSEEADGIKAMYHLPAVKAGLGSTTYGQQALALDDENLLEPGKSAGVSWLGTELD